MLRFPTRRHDDRHRPRDGDGGQYHPFASSASSSLASAGAPPLTKAPQQKQPPVLAQQSEKQQSADIISSEQNLYSDFYFPSTTTTATAKAVPKVTVIPSSTNSTNSSTGNGLDKEQYLYSDMLFLYPGRHTLQHKGKDHSNRPRTVVAAVTTNNVGGFPPPTATTSTTANKDSGRVDDDGKGRHYAWEEYHLADNGGLWFNFP